MNELEFIDTLDRDLEAVFEEAVIARDRAQAVLEQVQRIRRERLTKRSIELQRALLAEQERK